MIRENAEHTDRATLLLDKLQTHADSVLRRSQSNARYAAQVLLKKEQVKDLLSNQTGIVEGVVSTWIDDFRPLAQELFGAAANDEEALVLPVLYGNFSPTLIPGVSARIRRVSLDEIMGPMLALDITAQEHV